MSSSSEMNENNEVYGEFIKKCEAITKDLVVAIVSTKDLVERLSNAVFEVCQKLGLKAYEVVLYKGGYIYYKRSKQHFVPSSNCLKVSKPLKIALDILEASINNGIREQWQRVYRKYRESLIESLKKDDSNLENVDMEKLEKMTQGKFIQGEDQELYLGWLPEAYQVGNNEDENDDEDENIDEGELPAVLEVRDMFLIRIVYL